MLRRRKRHQRTSAQYRFYEWENGSYVATNGGEFPSDHHAVLEAQRHASSQPLERPASLEAPHIHVIRADGIHIMTLELPASGARTGMEPAGALCDKVQSQLVL